MKFTTEICRNEGPNFNFLKSAYLRNKKSRTEAAFSIGLFVPIVDVKW